VLTYLTISAGIAAGLGLLVVAAHLLVRGAITLSAALGVSKLFVGMTVVALGTSAPELVTGLAAAVLEDAPVMALGGILGSNLANLLFVLGAAGLVAPIAVDRRPLGFDAVAFVGSVLLFGGLAARGTIGTVSGMVLLAAFAVFLGVSFRRRNAKSRGELIAEALEVDEARISGPWWIAALYCAAGVGGLYVGAELLVQGGVALAINAGAREEVIGLTLIAFGTSLPELAASVVAAFRGHAPVAVGNVIGSNVFNLVGVLGAVSVAAPLPVPPQVLHFDFWVVLAATVLFLPFMAGRWRMNRAVCAGFLVAYGGYIALQAQGAPGLF